MRRKKAHLVTQHMELISRDALEQYQDVLKEIAHRRHGIYALYRKGKLCYVGLAKNLRRRLKHHLKDRHATSWDAFSVYLTLDVDHIRELEALVIRIATPKENRQRGRLRKSEDLRKVFRRSLKERFNEHMAEIFIPRVKMGKPRKAADLEVAKKPVLAGYFKNRMRLRFTYKGKTFKASVRKNGTIRSQHVTYNSPSGAAMAITKRPIDGWHAWKYERAPGIWVQLDEARKG